MERKAEKYVNFEKELKILLKMTIIACFEPFWRLNINLFNPLLDYTLRIYKYRCEEMGTDPLSTPYHIPDESTNRKLLSLTGTDNNECYGDDIDIYSGVKNELEPKKNQHSLPSSKK